MPALRDKQGRFTAHAVHQTVGAHPEIPLSDLVRDVDHLSHYIHMLMDEANLNEGGAQALLHHALSAARTGGGFSWGDFVSGAKG